MPLFTPFTDLLVKPRTLSRVKMDVVLIGWALTKLLLFLLSLVSSENFHLEFGYQWPVWLGWQNPHLLASLDCFVFFGFPLHLWFYLLIYVV